MCAAVCPTGGIAIETLFAFCVDGDVLHAEPDERLSLDVSRAVRGDASEPADNLVLRAARALREARGRMLDGGAALTLDKRLPVASGIGGGSADAAAALRLLTRMWRHRPGARVGGSRRRLAPMSRPAC